MPILIGIVIIELIIICGVSWVLGRLQKGKMNTEEFTTSNRTAIENGLDPYRYLSWLLSSAAEMDLAQSDNFELLLPWYAPAVCKT